jgi:hypothetical protein
VLLRSPRLVHSITPNSAQYHQVIDKLHTTVQRSASRDIIIITYSLFSYYTLIISADTSQMQTLPKPPNQQDPPPKKAKLAAHPHAIAAPRERSDRPAGRPPSWLLAAQRTFHASFSLQLICARQRQLAQLPCLSHQTPRPMGSNNGHP